MLANPATIDSLKLSAVAILMTLVVALGSADRAGAATADIGAVGEITEGTPPAPTAPGGFVVQVGEAAGSYAVPPGYGTISSWRHSAGGTAGTLTFKVYRPTGALREFVAVASDTRAVTAGSVQSFPVRIPVRPGDRIGLSSDDLQLVYETFNPADQLGFFDPADPPPGTTKTTDGPPFEQFKLDVAATLESDPDAPGRGPASPGGAPTGSGSRPVGAPATRPFPTSSSMAAVTRLRIAPDAFSSARSGPSVTKRRSSGARVSYSVKARAAVRFTIRQARPGRRKGSGERARCVSPTRANRVAARCSRTVTIAGSFEQTARKGANSFRFAGRLGGRPLEPGAYTLVATLRSGGKSGRPVTRRFRITR